MIRINENYLKLQASYLFSEIGKRATAFQEAHPDREIIKLGIGDVTRPLPGACIDAFHRAVDEMADITTFRGYGPEQGYDFLRQAIAKEDFQECGADISADEIFVSDGTKCDTANIQEIKEAAELGMVDGVTTNPSLVAREGREFKGLIKEICGIVDGPVNAEVISVKAEAMIKEAEELADLVLSLRRREVDREDVGQWFRDRSTSHESAEPS